MFRCFYSCFVSSASSTSSQNAARPVIAPTAFQKPSQSAARPIPTTATAPTSIALPLITPVYEGVPASHRSATSDRLETLAEVQRGVFCALPRFEAASASRA